MIHSIKFHKWTPTREPTGRCHVHNIILSHFSYGNCLNVSNFTQFNNEISFNILTNIEKVKVNFAPFSLPKHLNKNSAYKPINKKVWPYKSGVIAAVFNKLGVS